MSVATALPDRGAHAQDGGVRRLTTLDRMFVRFESGAWPSHFAGLAVVEGPALLEGSGAIRLDEITERVDRRLGRVPELRRRLHFPGFLRGGPLWVDDDRFDVRNHVREACVDPPGGDLELMEAAARICGRLLDRGRPLWEFWLLTGLSDGRVGVLLKLHHSVADGTGALAVMGALFDAADATEPGPDAWTAEAIPDGWTLFADNLARQTRSVALGAGWLAHPRRLAQAMGVAATVIAETVGHPASPLTSLNQPVRAGRRIRVLRLDLSAMKRAARCQRGTVNDVVLDLWAGGLRQLLVSRGEPVDGLELAASQAVSLRSATDRSVGNQVGAMTVPLPAWEADARSRLDLIVRRTHERGNRQRSAQMMGILASLSALPIARSGSRHQHAVNVRVSNVVGPRRPVSIFGAPVLEIVPIVRLFGNVGLVLCAFSYGHRLSMVVTADEAAFPDLDVLVAGMERDWRVLIGGLPPDLVPGPRPVPVGSATQGGGRMTPGAPPETGQR